MSKTDFESPSQVRSQRPPLRIGLSARLMHNPPPELGFRHKKLQYIEQTIAHWILAEGALALMIPTLEAEGGLHRSVVQVSDYVRAIDGLVLQGGTDISPTSYGEEAMHPDWSGDRVRDLYELDLIWECIIQNKPVLGICRGCQLINVAFGGSLYQDIFTQLPQAHLHVDAAAYDQYTHCISLVPDSFLARLYPTLSHTPHVISIHHQAVKELGSGLEVEARSTEDGIVEAIRWTGNGFVYGVQWHPEFHHSAQPSDLLNSDALLREFLRVAEDKRKT